MPIVNPYTFRSMDPQQTYAMGTTLGRLLADAAVILLTGDLGSGKTRFVQGLAQGLDVPRLYDITSPSYTLVNEYPGRLPLIHIDLYRLATLEDAETIGLWELLAQPAVIAVEWADRLAAHAWPADALHIAFTATTATQRNLTLFGDGLDPGNLIEKLAAEWSLMVQQIE